MREIQASEAKTHLPRLPARHPRSMGLLPRLDNRPCAGGRDTPGHDGEREHVPLYPPLV